MTVNCHICDSINLGMFLKNIYNWGKLYVSERELNNHIYTIS